MEIRGSRIVPLFILIFLHVLQGCASVQVKDVAIKPASDYKMFKSHSGLNIAIDLFLEDERILDVFGDNILARGFLPILFVIENHCTDRAFLVVKNHVQLHIDRGNTEGNRPAPKASEDLKDEFRRVQRENTNLQSSVPDASMAIVASGQIGQSLTYMNLMNMSTSAVTALTGIGVGLMVLTGPLIENARVNTIKLRRNLEKRELVDRTIYPGETHTGFIYFPLVTGTVPADIRQVQVNLTDMKTRNSLILLIPIAGSE